MRNGNAAPGRLRVFHCRDRRVTIANSGHAGKRLLFCFARGRRNAGHILFFCNHLRPAFSAAPRVLAFIESPTVFSTHCFLPMIRDFEPQNHARMSSSGLLEEVKQTMRSPRYNVRDVQPTRASLEPSPGFEVKGTSVTLLDLSREGAQLSVPYQLELDSHVRLRLANQEAGLDVPIDAVVRWVRTEEPDGYITGCEFRPPLPAEAIEGLMLIGCLDDEKPAREPAGGEVTAWRESTPEPFTARPVDLSPGGISLLSPEAVQSGERIRLGVSKPNHASEYLLVEVRWCAETGKGFILGCEFETTGAYQLLRSEDYAHVATARSIAALKKLLRRHSPLVSRTTILILGAVVMGTSLRLPTPFCSLISLFTIVVFLSLEVVDKKRQQHKGAKWDAFFDKLLARRLEERLIALKTGWTEAPAEPLAPRHERSKVEAVST